MKATALTLAVLLFVGVVYKAGEISRSIDHKNRAPVPADLEISDPLVIVMQPAAGPCGPHLRITLNAMCEDFAGTPDLWFRNMRLMPNFCLAEVDYYELPGGNTLGCCGCWAGGTMCMSCNPLVPAEGGK